MGRLPELVTPVENEMAWDGTQDSEGEEGINEDWPVKCGVVGDWGMSKSDYYAGSGDRFCSVSRFLGFNHHMRSLVFRARIHLYRFARYQIKYGARSALTSLGSSSAAPSYEPFPALKASSSVAFTLRSSMISKPRELSPEREKQDRHGPG